MHIKILTDIAEDEWSLFGRKAAYLGKIARDGLLVPHGFAIGVQDAELTQEDRDLFAAFITECGLQHKKLAVRSSAKDEDGFTFSLAGKYKSFLNVNDISSSINSCLQQNDSVTSVIVQEMIEADFGGVCFSSSPENSTRISIELCLGANTGVTQGLGVTARIWFDKETHQLVNADDPSNLLKELSRDQLSDLAQICSGLESKWGYPVDVEWCVSQNTLYFLQARPLTGLQTASAIASIKEQELARLKDMSAKGSSFWTDFSVGEMFGNPSPLFLDLVNDDLGENWSTRRVFSDLGLAPAKKLQGPLFQSICGRAYIDIDNYLRFIFPNSALVKHIPLSTAHAFRAFVRLPYAFFKLRKRFHTDYSQKRLNGSKQQAREILNSNQWQRLELKELYQKFEDIRHILGHQIIYAHLMSDVVAAMSQALVSFILKFLFGKNAQEWEYKLTTGLPGNFNSETTLRLYDLAQGKIDLESFLEEFGHRGNPDWDIASKRWREAPEKVLRMLSSIEKSRTNFRAQFANQQKTKNAAEKALSSYLDDRFWRRPFASFILKQVRYLQIYSPLREETQSVVYAWIEVLRSLCLVIGQKTSLGEDIFFLTKEEFAKLCLGEISATSSAAIAKERRQKLLLARRVYLPHFFGRKDLTAKLFEPPSDAFRGEVLEGTKVSGGKILGRAMVLTDLDEAGDIQSTDILVTRFADPSFSPLILSAGGLVLEQGSVHSHSAIVAREFGLPALVNVAFVTSKIKTGQTIMLDADKGQVWVSG